MSAPAQAWACPFCRRSDGLTYLAVVRGIRERLWAPDFPFSQLVADDDLEEHVPSTVGECVVCRHRSPLPPEVPR